jgi:hypothetical protein
MSRNIIAALQPRNLKITIGEALLAAAAAAVVLNAGLLVWVMFLGWISYFTRGLTIHDGVFNFVSMLIGLGLGLGAGIVLRGFGSDPSLVEQVCVIFGVAVTALSLRFLPRVNNLLAFFLGLVAFFAAHPEPTLAGLVPLVAASAIGVAAGAAAHKLQLWLQASPSAAPVGKASTS